jgi:hypothetical protein
MTLLKVSQNILGHDIGMPTSLVETKQANSNVKLVAKHCIFTLAIIVGASFTRGIVWMLSVHHQNVCVAIVHQALMCDSGCFCGHSH